MSGIGSTTEIIKVVVLKINDDVLVKKKTGMIKQVKNIVAATA